MTGNFYPDRRKDNTPKWKKTTEIRGVWIAGGLLLVNIGVVIATWLSANAARSAAETTAKQLESSERPWVTIKDVTVVGHARYGKRDVIDFKYRLENYGSSRLDSKFFTPAQHLVAPLGFFGEESL